MNSNPSSTKADSGHLTSAATKTVHSPLPWRYAPTNNGHMIAGATPGYVVEVRDCGSGDVRANAALIVRAVNSHAELVEAADNALGVFIACCVPAGGADDRTAILDAQRQLRSALSRATEGDQS